MRSVTLLSVTIRGFKAFKVEHTITFTPGGGLRFLGGVNKVDERLGANGAGKSSVWDAVFWCWYGVSVRGKKLSFLLSAESAEVSTQIKVGDEEFNIMRSGPPERIAIDGELVEQQAVDDLLGLSRARCLQSVLFGQAVPLFYDLSIPDRGALLDEVLDLGLWLKLADNAKKRATEKQVEVDEITRQVAFQQGKVASLQDNDALLIKEAEWREEQQRRVDSLLEKFEVAERESVDMEAEYDRAKAALDKLGDSASMRKQLAKMRQDKENRDISQGRLLRDVQALYQQRKFIDENDVCPHCSQTIGKLLKVRFCAEADAEIASKKVSNQHHALQLNMLNKEISALDNELSKLERKRALHESVMQEMQGRLLARAEMLDRMEKQIEEVAQDSNPYAVELAFRGVQRKGAEAELARLQKSEGELVAAHARFVYWQQGFKRVRLFLVKRVLLQLEVETANAADVLGLNKWRISFVTEVENKSGTMKPGVQILVQAPDTEAAREWSPGELQRVRVAVALGFANMIQRTAGVSYNFEVWDEPSNWLSAQGIEDLLECLRVRADAMQKSVWVVDHRALFYSGFSETWEAVKTKNGAIVRLQTTV